MKRRARYCNVRRSSNRMCRCKGTVGKYSSAHTVLYTLSLSGGGVRSWCKHSYRTHGTLTLFEKLRFRLNENTTIERRLNLYIVATRCVHWLADVGVYGTRGRIRCWDGRVYYVSLQVCWRSMPEELRLQCSTSGWSAWRGKCLTIITSWINVYRFCTAKCLRQTVNLRLIWLSFNYRLSKLLVRKPKNLRRLSTLFVFSG